MGNRPYHDKDTLEELYHEQGLSQQEIADKFGVADNTISKWFRKLDITARRFQDKPYKQEDVLRYLHHEEEMPWSAIADKFDVDTGSIQYWMKKHGIESLDPNRKQYHIPEDELRQLYIEEEKPACDIAEEYGCDSSVIAERLEEYDIPKRDAKERQRLIHGDYAPLDVHPSTGYRRWRDTTTEIDVYTHRLTAVAGGCDPWSVFGDNEYHIHHKNTFKVDNRPDNLELVTENQHMATHRSDEWVERDGWPELRTVPEQEVETS